MTGVSGAELRAWQHRLGLRSDKLAADMLGMSISSYRRKCKERASISRQDQILMACIEALDRVSRDTATQIIPPGTGAQVIATLTKIGILPGKGGD